MYILKDQKGFGFIEGLLIAIIVTLIIGVGVYVVNANKDKKEDIKASEATSQTIATKPAEKKYLEIKELGIKIPTDTIKNVTYKLSDVSTSDSKVYIFSDSEISKSVNACRLSGEKADDWRIYEVFRGDGEFSPNRGAGSTAELLKQFDTFHVGYIGQPNFSPCTDLSGTSVDNAEITSAIEKAQIELQKAFEGAEKL